MPLKQGNAKETIEESAKARGDGDTAACLQYAKIFHLDEWDESAVSRDESGRFSSSGTATASALNRAKALQPEGSSFHSFAQEWHAGQIGVHAENLARSVNSAMGIEGNSIGGIKDEFKQQIAIRAEQAGRQALMAAQLHAEGKEKESIEFARGAHRAADMHESLRTSEKGKALAEVEKLRQPPAKLESLRQQVRDTESLAKYEKAVNAWRLKQAKAESLYNRLSTPIV